MKKRIIIIGGVAAGPAAAAEARRTNPEVEIILIEKGDAISYSACEMPLYIGGEVEDPSELVRYEPDVFADRFNLQVRVHTEVTSIDAETRHIDLIDHESGEADRLHYDGLILATGARAVVPDSLKAASHHVHVVRELSDASALVTSIESRDIRHAVIAGAGYVGIDMAGALRHRGIRTSMLASRGRILPHALDADMSLHARDAIELLGVSIRDERANGLEVAPDGSLKGVHTDAGELIGCDLALIAAGTEPRLELADSAGLDRGPAGGLRVDENMRTSQPAIWACGDVVDFTDAVSGDPIHAPLALNAFRSGRVAGRNAARMGRGRAAVMPAVIRTAAIPIGSSELAHTGWSVESATKRGWDAEAVTIHGRSATMLAGGQRLHVRLVAEKGSRKLLGAQLIGKSGAALRVNTITALLKQQATVDALYDVDFVYSPRLAPLHDPLLVAARSLQKILNDARF